MRNLNLLIFYRKFKLRIHKRWLPLKSQLIMRYLMWLLFLVVFTSFNTPGSGTAYLTCKSESGRTEFTAELQDIVGPLEKAELKVDEKRLVFDDNDEVRTIFDAQSGVFTIYITCSPTKDFPNGRFVQFWAIPKSFKVIKSDRSNQRYEFKAKIEATEPRSGDNRDLRIPTVVLSCLLEYRI